MVHINIRIDKDTYEHFHRVHPNPSAAIRKVLNDAVEAYRMSYMKNVDTEE